MFINCIKHYQNAELSNIIQHSKKIVDLHILRLQSNITVRITTTYENKTIGQGSGTKEGSRFQI